ncbi:MAG: S8 family peptidase [Gammaproteobacteria bacterium]|nr:S8 family peptidase [Gammaproteobacteria bacterium]
MRSILLAALRSALLTAVALPLWAQVAPERFLVKLRAGSVATAAQPAPGEVRERASRAGFNVIEARHIVAGIHLLRAVGPRGAELARLRADPAVEYVEPDRRRHAQAIPDDPLFTGQWFLQNVEPSAVDALSAWDATTGSNGVVIAELDTGVRFEHPDLRNAAANRLLPGYNMIGPDPDGSYLTGNDGGGRDADASDPGDWVSASDIKLPLFASCKPSNSSWHGTRVAGILGAITNNATGVAGLTWSGWILPVRVLGKCGGYDSDILAAMGWAAGLPVDGVPANPYPAQILNMSLGATGSCPASYQTVVSELVNIGVLIVVAAGNEGGPVDAPANCTGVAAVAGLRHVGTKVGFSSLGPQIALSAPAGNCVNTGLGQPCLFSIDTTSNTGTTVPAASTYTDQSNFNVGTSFSAPIVAGIAGLMLAVNGNLTAGQLINRLQLGAGKPFPTPSGVPPCHVPASSTDLQTSECSCTTDTCGAGMANAHGAVLEALRPIAAVALPAQVSAGATVMLDASGSGAACGAHVVSYAWSVVSPSANPPALQNPHGPQASLTAPSGGTVYQLLLTVTDDSGRTDSAAVDVSASRASSSAPARAGSNACLTPVSYSVNAPPPPASPGTGSGSGGGGGGGGGIDLVTLAMLLGAYARRSAAASHSRCARR